MAFHCVHIALGFCSWTLWLFHSLETINRASMNITVQMLFMKNILAIGVEVQSEISGSCGAQLQDFGE